MGSIPATPPCSTERGQTGPNGIEKLSVRILPFFLSQVANQRQWKPNRATQGGWFAAPVQRGADRKSRNSHAYSQLRQNGCGVDPHSDDSAT